MTGPTPSSAVHIGALPPSLVDLLTREIALLQTRPLVLQSLDAARRQLQTLKATRSPFFMLQSQDTRRDSKASQEEAEAAIAKAEKNIARLDRVEPQLKSFVAYRLETYLRAASHEYVHALLERRNVADWQRWLSWFEHYSKVFRSTLALLEATIATLQPTQTLAYHPQCAMLLSQATEAAHHIEIEVGFFNKIADFERRISGPGAHTIYRQLSLDWCSAVNHLSEADGKQGPQMISQFISQFMEVSRNITRALHDECTRPVSAEAVETTSFHARQWARLRSAIQPRVLPAQIDNLVRETDGFLSNGRISELARMQEELQTTAKAGVTTAPFMNGQPGAAPNPAGAPKPKTVLQLRSRRVVTGAPFGDTPSSLG